MVTGPVSAFKLWISKKVSRKRTRERSRDKARMPLAPSTFLSSLRSPQHAFTCINIFSLHQFSCLASETLHHIKFHCPTWNATFITCNLWNCHSSDNVLSIENLSPKTRKSKEIFQHTQYENGPKELHHHQIPHLHSLSRFRNPSNLGDSFPNKKHLPSNDFLVHSNLIFWLFSFKRVQIVFSK